MTLHNNNIKTLLTIFLKVSSDPLTSSTGRCILRKFLRSPFSISSIMSRAGCPSETTPSNRTTWLQEKALVTENSPKNETQCTLCVKESYNNLTTTLYQHAAITTILVLALRSKGVYNGLLDVMHYLIKHFIFFLWLHIFAVN